LDRLNNLISLVRGNIPADPWQWICETERSTAQEARQEAIRLIDSVLGDIQLGDGRLDQVLVLRGNDRQELFDQLGDLNLNNILDRLDACFDIGDEKYEGNDNITRLNHIRTVYQGSMNRLRNNQNIYICIHQDDLESIGDEEKERLLSAPPPLTVTQRNDFHVFFGSCHEYDDDLGTEIRIAQGRTYITQAGTLKFIALCDNFFSKSRREKGGIILHEATHLCDEPFKTRHNCEPYKDARRYELFAMNLSCKDLEEQRRQAEYWNNYLN